MNIELDDEQNDIFIYRKFKESGLPVVIAGKGSIGLSSAEQLRRNGIEDITHVLLDVNAKTGGMKLIPREIYQKDLILYLALKKFFRGIKTGWKMCLEIV